MECPLNTRAVVGPELADRLGDELQVVFGDDQVAPALGSVAVARLDRAPVVQNNLDELVRLTGAVDAVSDDRR